MEYRNPASTEHKIVEGDCCCGLSCEQHRANLRLTVFTVSGFPAGTVPSCGLEAYLLCDDGVHDFTRFNTDAAGLIEPPGGYPATWILYSWNYKSCTSTLGYGATYNFTIGIACTDEPSMLTIEAIVTWANQGATIVCQWESEPKTLQYTVVGGEVEIDTDLTLKHQFQECCQNQDDIVINLTTNPLP